MAVSRRVFLKLAVTGSTAAVAAGAGIKNPQRLISYVEPMDHHRPGSVTLFATTCRECPAGCGMHLWQREARVVKAEGNPKHPINTGTLCPRGQASLQGLYDPDRVTGPLRRNGATRTHIAWQEAIQAVGQKLSGGGQVLVISDLQTGLLAELMGRFARDFGGQAVLYEPVDYEYLLQGHAAAGLPAVVPHYHLEQSRFILSFAADFLETWVSPVEFARAFVRNRDLRDGQMGRFVYVGPRQSMTAANADELHLLPPSRLADAAWAILGQVLALAGDSAGIALRAGERLHPSGQSPLPEADAQRIAKAFVQSGSGVALAGAPAGGAAAADLAMAVALLNQAVGATGQRVDYGQPHALTSAVGSRELAGALQDLDSNTLVLIHSTNPVYSAPHLSEQLRTAGTIVCLGTMLDETAQLADWILPIDYPLESWGEYAPYHGLTGLLQPTMGRLYDTRLAGDLLMAIALAGGKPLDGDPHSFRDRLRARYADGDYQRGFVQSSGSPAAATGAPASRPAAPAQQMAANGPDLAELWVYPSILRYDGRLANRAWMQEIGEPVTFSTWGSWLDMHPKKALSLGLRQDMVVRLERDGRSIEVPVRITEEIDQNTVGLELGQGHTQFGRFANGIGANGWMIVPGRAEGFFGAVTLQRTDRIDSPAYISPTEQQHHREILQWMPLAQASKLKAGEHDQLIMPLPEGYQQNRDMYPPHQYKEHRWAMVVDLNRCIGCGACTAACYAENNVPIVGKEQVAMSREMAWLRVVPYRNQEDPHKLGWIPLLCQQCDAAPCEPVCPVFASVHNEEGLNAQVYNRCIGTRYCNNNCPYKVRRFNWRDPVWIKPLDMQLNPEVTARSRGVMEKCTFCIQRIKAGEYQAKIENRKVRDGDIQTACQQTCPTDVFSFGDLMDPESAVSKLIRKDPRAYQVLKELNTKPAVIYLKRIDGGKT